MTSDSTKITIGTHNGTFHCDEALACSLLKMLPRYREAEIVRTRDPTVLATCSLVVDVGGEYDPASLRFDHHQKTFSHSVNSLDGSKKWTTKLSSAGLVYFHFGREIISELLETKSPQLTEKVFDKVYEHFIQEIDAIDNGISTHDGEGRYSISTNLSSRVSRLSPHWNEAEEDSDLGFYRALELTRREFLERLDYYGKVWWAARDMVSHSVQARFMVHQSGRVIELTKKGIPWQEHLFELEAENNLSGDSSILYVLHNHGDHKDVGVEAVPVSHKSFDSRLGLPQEWRGLRDAQLEEVSGTAGARFVHSTGFCGANKTRGGALEMAEKALKYYSDRA